MCFRVDADDEDLVVLPYHRALKTSVDGVEIDRRMTERFAVRPARQRLGVRRHEKLGRRSSSSCCTYRELRCSSRSATRSSSNRSAWRGRAWRDLDVVALHEAVLPLVLPEGVDDLLFTKDPEEILRLVEHDGWTAGILLRALHPAQVVEVARSGERMPQKASYFLAEGAHRTGVQDPLLASQGRSPSLLLALGHR